MNNCLKSNQSTKTEELEILQINKIKSILPKVILTIIFFISFSSRLFSILKFEPIIHEFDPWFQYRATKYLSDNGRAAFYNWFDKDSWYPFGREIGKTLYPGLMYTSLFIHRFLKFIAIPLDLLHVCVLMAPLFSIFTCYFTYRITKEISGKKEAGLFGALFVSLISSYLSRSTAGAYDNEAISITILVSTLYFFIRACNKDSFMYAMLSAISFGYLAASWGGYAFIIGFIPVFVLGCLITGKLNDSIKRTYNIFYIFGTLLASEVKFIEYKVWSSGEHLPSHLIFIVLQLISLYNFLSLYFSKDKINKVLNVIIVLGMVSFLAALPFLKESTNFTERVLSLIDPSYAKSYAPIVASVSEHQSSGWAIFFQENQFLLLFAPIGVIFMLQNTTHLGLFIVFYLLITVYFTGLMVRLLLMSAPAIVILAAIGISNIFSFIFSSGLTEQHNENESTENENINPNTEDNCLNSNELTNNKNSNLYDKNCKFKFVKLFWNYIKSIKLNYLLLIAILVFIVSKYMFHGSFMASEVYSNPTVILSSLNPQTGEKTIIDDFREGYYWIRKNTPETSKILSWWDYGYQLAGFTNRTTYIDNNTNNYQHIANIARILVSDEESVKETLDELDVDYVLVLFGGKLGYGADDLNKFGWIFKIAANEFPYLLEIDYMDNNQMLIGENAKVKFTNSLIYKLSFYRFNETQTSMGPGVDQVRRQQVKKEIKLKYFEEVYTTRNWLLRIYKYKKEIKKN